MHIPAIHANVLINMALRCTVCDHPQRSAIDSLIAVGIPSQRVIASQYGLKQAAIDRHKRNGHLSQRLTKAIERKADKADDTFMDGILNGIQTSQQGVETGMARASEVSAEVAYRLAPGFLAQQARFLELLGTATGGLAQQQSPAAGSPHITIVMPRSLDLPHGQVVDIPAIQAPDPTDES